MEKILKIENVYSEKATDKDWDTCDGYKITTDNQTIKLLISDGQSCCEHWGYFMSEDNLEQFIGASLTDISITDTCLNTQKLIENDVGDGSGQIYEGGIMFVNIATSKGVLQFTAYNEHNGYYGHGAYVISNQLTHEEGL